MAKIRLKYVNTFSNKARSNKRQRFYFRKRGMKDYPTAWRARDSEEFMQAYAMAFAGTAGCQARDRREAHRSRHDRCIGVSYYRSTEWASLAEDTKDTRRRIIEKFRTKHGGKRVRLLAEAHL